MNKRFIVLVVLLATIVPSGCGGDYNGPKLGGSTAVVDTTPPAVSSTNPTNGATNVSATVNISATFSEAINPLSKYRHILRDGWCYRRFRYHGGGRNDSNI